MKKVGIFGGRFDPIHIGHVIVALDIYEKVGLDDLIFLVSFNPPHKGCEASFEDRFEMVKICLNDIGFSDIFKVSDVEKKLNLENSYTALVLPHLRDLGELFFIIGLDQFRSFPSWYKPEEILTMCNILVVKRRVDEPPLENPFVNSVRFVDTRVIDISSSDIRRRIKEGKYVSPFLTPGVLKYIKDRGLYT